MTRSRSRLDAVQRVRALQEQIARGRLAAAHADVAVARGREGAALELYAARPLLPATMTARDFQEHVAAAGRYVAHVQAAASAVGEAVQAVASRQSEWSSAAQSLAAVDRLLERQRAARAIELVRAEQRDLDEIAAIRHTRRSR